MSTEFGHYAVAMGHMPEPISPSQARMDEVVKYAQYVARAKREGLSRRTIASFQKSYDEAVRQYTRPTYEAKPACGCNCH